jgi:hypothetical protein
MNERLAILLLSLSGAGCALRRCFARVGAASARSFFVCVCGGYQFLVLEGLSSLTTLVCSLLDPNALFDHRRDQTDPTLILHHAFH